MEVKAPAKINLGLHVLARRDDGYHDIETAMVAVDWCDVLNFETSSELSLTCSDERLPTDESNLVIRAALALRDHTGSTEAARIHLQKNVPFAAGLGGGSSDAAATLKALNDLWELKLPDNQLEEIAARLGSDIPFFIKGVPAMATGRGEKLEPLDSFKLEHEVLIVTSGEGISTADAYGNVTPSGNGRPDIKNILLNQPVEQWERALVNDFQEVAFTLRPGLAKIYDYMVVVGTDYVSLSGSGSAIYGLFADAEMCRRAAVKLRGYGLTAWNGSAIGAD